MRLIKNYTGFTLMEILLVVALMGVLAGASMPVYRFFQQKNDLDIAAMAVAQTLRKAKVYAEGSNSDSAWGAKILSGNIVMFKGNTYASRDTAFDESFEISPAVAFSGQSETVFSGVPSVPNASGTLVLSSAQNSAKVITISSKGMILY